jgi:hypothetical protein
VYTNDTGQIKRSYVAFRVWDCGWSVLVVECAVVHVGCRRVSNADRRCGVVDTLKGRATLRLSFYFADVVVHIRKRKKKPTTSDVVGCVWASVDFRVILWTFLSAK